MAITSLNLKIEGRRVRHEYSGLVTFERVYEAILDSKADNEETVLSDALVPLMYSAHPDAVLQPAIVINRVAESISASRLVWRILLTYGQHQISPFSSGDESFDPDRFDEPNPFKQRATWTFVARQEPLHAARMILPGATSINDFSPSKLPVTTSALMGYSPLPTVDIYEPFVTVTRNVVDPSPTLLTFRNSTNINAIVIDGVPVLAYAARMSNLSVSPPKKDKDSGIVFRTITMPIYLRAHQTVRIPNGQGGTKEVTVSGWDIALLDQGHYQRTSDGSLERIRDDTMKDDVDLPHLLDDGSKVTWASWPPTEQEIRDKATYRVYRWLNELDWGPLQLR